VFERWVLTEIGVDLVIERENDAEGPGIGPDCEVERLRFQ
jgi:hypothetical protein